MTEIRSNGSDKDYRAMHQALIRKGFAVDKDSVRLVLKELDPEGVALRSRHKLRRRKYYAKGPNDIWILDGNDKLKPYRFSIHGRIDGFSRKILWLKLSPSNKNPSEMVHYYLNTVLKVGGVPRRMRADRGVENATVAGLQRFLRRNKSHQNCSFYLENLLQISELKFGGRTYEKYFYRDGSIILKTKLTKVCLMLLMKLIKNA